MPTNKFQKIVFALLTVVITVHAFVFFSLYVVNGNLFMQITGENSVLNAINKMGGISVFNNMIPIHKDALIEYDINGEPDEKYKRLLQRQIAFCNKIKADILNHAQMTYFAVVAKQNKFYVEVSCNFKELEKACKAYKKDFKSKVKHP